MEPFRGSVLFVDVAGFTPLTVSLSSEGPVGLQHLQRIMGDYYVQLIRIIRRFGGVVYSFAGDSILATMVRDDENGESDEKSSLRACSCALAIQDMMGSMEEAEACGKKFRLLAKIVVVGTAVHEAVESEKMAEGGEILVSREVRRLLPLGTRGRERGSHYKIEKLSAIQPGPEISYSLDTKLSQRVLLEECSKFLNPALFRKFTSGYKGFIGAYREVTCVFLRFECPERDTGGVEAIHDLNQYYEVVQRESVVYGGNLIQTDLSDKGNLILILFGAPRARENKELLAVRLAIQLTKRRRSFPNITRVQAGITTGFAYCGDLGAPFRKGYTVIGEVANIAARLATHGDHDAVYVDTATELKTRKSFIRKKISPVSLKGVREPVEIYEVMSETGRLRGVPDSSSDVVFVRRKERKRLLELLQKASRGEGSVCNIVGDAGIGKSKLVESALGELSEFGMEALIGYCYSYERSTTFFPWREMLLVYFSIFDFEDRESKLEKIRREIDKLEDAKPFWADLTAEILGIPVSEEATGHLEARQKYMQFFEIVYNLLNQRTKKTPLLLYFEDAQWMDEVSLDLIEYMALRISALPVMIVIVSRPDSRFNVLEQLEDFVSLNIAQLSEEEAGYFLRHKLNLHPQNPGLEGMILNASQGNPFFLESIVRSLVEESHIVTHEDAPSELVSKVEKISIPNSLQELVLSRIDRLPENEQVTLKSASVIGKLFHSDTLRALLPEEMDHESVSSSLETLRRMDLIRMEPEDPLLHSFKNSVIQDVAYDSLLLSTRQNLHHRLASYLEETVDGFLNEWTDVLAYHFLHGNDKQKALDYALLSALKARGQFANRDAIGQFRKCLGILTSPGFVTTNDMVNYIKTELAECCYLVGEYEESVSLYSECLKEYDDPLEKLDIHLGLARVFRSKGDTRRALEELEKSLSLLGKRPRYDRFEVQFAFLAQFSSHLWRLMFPGAAGKSGKNNIVSMSKEATILHLMCDIFFRTDDARFKWAVFAYLNLAHRLSSDYDLSQALASLGLVRRRRT